MENKEATGNYYTIGHVVQFTGLTDRTIRNYIASGLLTGEKINGLWHFTPEQVEAFLADPAVRPSIQAKAHGIVYDFLAFNPAKEDEACLILDFPGADREEVSEFFCTEISRGSFRNLQFSFDGLGGAPRVILKGDTEGVLNLAAAWYEKRKPAL